MSPAQPLQNEDGAARRPATTSSAAQRQLVDASQRMEQLDEFGADGAEFQTAYNSALEMESSFPNKTMMSLAQINGLGEDRSWIGALREMRMIRNDTKAKGYGQQLPAGIEDFIEWMEKESIYRDVLLLDDPSYEEAMEAIDLQVLLGHMGAGGGKDEAIHHTKMQTVPPGISDAALCDIDCEDEFIISPKGTTAQRSPMTPNDSLLSFIANFNLLPLEEFKNSPSIKAPSSLLSTAVTSELSVTVSTESKYTFQGQSINGHTHILASDFRAQLETAPPPTKKAKYPFTFSDREGVAPELPHPLLHIPVVPGQKESFKNGVDDPDVLRAIYPKDRANKGAVLARHDPEAGRTASGNGVMKRCNYHGARHRRRKGDGEWESKLAKIDNESYQKRINSWFFGKLATSRTELTLLATILSFMAAEPDVASLRDVIKLWDHDGAGMEPPKRPERLDEATWL